jgi:RecB family exonuclease
MKTLYVYPTARAIRAARENWREQDALMPSMMRIDEFEQRSIRLHDRIMVDPLQRVLLFRQATDFADFEVFGVERDLARFFTHSEGFFRFFEELAREEVDCARLAEADAYAEFDRHLTILSRLKHRYGEILDRRGLTDTMFVPEQAELNEAFIDQYERIELFLDGLLSRYEMKLFGRIAERTRLIVHYTTTPYSTKMEERFAQIGIVLPRNAHVTFEWQTQTLHERLPVGTTIRADVTAVRERFEQVGEAFAHIERMVEEGIAADRIALILPDETFKEVVRLYDRLNNLNFAMGFDYTGGRTYKILEAIRQFWRGRGTEEAQRLVRYGIEPERLDETLPVGAISATDFLEALAAFVPAESDHQRAERLEEAVATFVRLFADERLGRNEWIYLWMRMLETIRLDDVRGGLVTVMGVLETRGVAYDGVVIVDFNDGIVPAAVSKDRFLNSQVRAFADLPTRSDREALQKHYYHRLLSQAKRSVIIYTEGDEHLPSPFVYEMGLAHPRSRRIDYRLLYDFPSRLRVPDDPTVASFDPEAVTWSATRLRVWLGCKRRYYYRYIRHLEPKNDTAVNEGAFLHTLLDRLYCDHSRFDDPEKLRDRLYRLMDELLPDTEARIAYYKHLWKRKLEPFIARQIDHFRDGWRVVAREKAFEGTLGGLRFKGRIDRIDLRGDRALVIDYKSGSLSEANRANNVENTIDFQMNIYRRLIRPEYPDAVLAFWQIFDNGEMVEAKALDEKDAVLDAHLDTLKQTRHFVAEKTDDLQQCRHCDYALMCGRGAYVSS